MEEYNELLIKANKAPGYIRVQPNPAKDYIIVEYSMETISGKGCGGNTQSDRKRNIRKKFIIKNTRL
ncbi:MAG: hypothetical protein R2764_02320 [Bacteroidales bacterium]